MLRVADRPHRARDPRVARQYRQDLIARIWDQWSSQNPGFARRAIRRVVEQMQPDHMHELQLLGVDLPENIQMLDAFTNFHIGTQQI